MQSVALPTIGMAALYAYYFRAGSEQSFTLIWIWKLNHYMLIIALVCYAIDALFFIFDKHMFCTMQAMKPTLKCNERNEYFLL